MIGGQAILTATQMRASERAAGNSGIPLSQLMDNAGRMLAETVYRIAAGRPIHILAGAGNSGGDGYVAAVQLRRMGARVHVSAAAPPATELARSAAEGWGEAPTHMEDPPLANAVLVDCLFGTGLNRRLDDPLAAALGRHASVAARSVAADLPSGVASDDGRLLNCHYHADVTLAFGALKPAHVLFPAAAHCGIVRLADIGMPADSTVRTARLPEMSMPRHDSQKYRRGLVCVMAGVMPGAAELAARAAARSGAGYVRILGNRLAAMPPFAIVRDSGNAIDERTTSIVIGPGLGKGESARASWDAAMAAARPMVIDADALPFIAGAPLTVPAILTPHAGEFDRMWAGSGNKIERTRDAAKANGAVVIHKGADTVIAAPDGRVAIHSPGNVWLSTAGTGDVLAGICGAMLARGLDPFDAAQAAVLLHQRAADRLAPGLIADDLVQRGIWP